MDKNLPPQPPRGGSLTIDKKGNGYFESLTFHADGKIDRYREEFYKGEKTKILQSTIEKPDSLKSRFVPIFEKSKEGKTENLKDAGLKKSERSEFENEIYKGNDLSKSERDQRENLKEKGSEKLNSSAEIFEKSKEGKTENLKSQEAGFEKSQEGKIENLKEAGLKKSERSEFENEIYQSNDLSKSERSETSEIEKSGGKNEIER